MFNERIERLVRKGHDMTRAILIEWDNIEKGLLSLEWLQRVWMMADPKDHRKAEAWELIKERIKTPEQLQRLLEKTPFGTPEKTEVLKLVTERIDKVMSK